MLTVGQDGLSSVRKSSAIVAASYRVELGRIDSADPIARWLPPVGTYVILAGSSQKSVLQKER